MNTVIVYDSQFGTTEQIARAIAERLGSARLVRVEEAGALAHPVSDLLIVVSTVSRFVEQTWTSAVRAALIQSGFPSVPATF